MVSTDVCSTNRSARIQYKDSNALSTRASCSSCCLSNVNTWAYLVRNKTSISDWYRVGQIEGVTEREGATEGVVVEDGLPDGLMVG